MGRSWTLNGPENDRYTLAELAAMLGYESADAIRRLVAEGRLPAPRGLGTAQFYSGSDVAIIWEMFGRWMPAAKTDEKQQKAAKTDERQRKAESED